MLLFIKENNKLPTDKELQGFGKDWIIYSEALGNIPQPVKKGRWGAKVVPKLTPLYDAFKKEAENFKRKEQVRTLNEEIEEGFQDFIQHKNRLDNKSEQELTEEKRMRQMLLENKKEIIN